MISARDFLRLIDDRVERFLQSGALPVATYRYATVTSTSPLYVWFEGDVSASTTAMIKLGGYTAVNADRVLCVKTGKTYVVMGKVA